MIHNKIVIIKMWLLALLIVFCRECTRHCLHGNGPLPLPYPWCITDSSIKVAEGPKLTSSWCSSPQWLGAHHSNTSATEYTVHLQGRLVWALMCVYMLSHFSHVWFFATLWTVACLALLSMAFSRQGYWSGLPCPPSVGFLNLGPEPTSVMSPALADGFFTSSAPWEGGH